MFKVLDVEFTTKITLKTARRLKESKVVDLLDSDTYADLCEILSKPLKTLDLLWEIVKGQAAAADIDRDRFEESLDIETAFESLRGDIENFIQILGEDSTARWLGFKGHARAILKEQTDAIEGMLQDPRVRSLIEKHKDDAMSALELGSPVKTSPEN